MRGICLKANDTYIRNGLLAGKTLGQEHFIEVILAVGFAIVSFKVAWVQDFVATWVRANKALWMPFLAKGKHRLWIQIKK